jgi:hypothetical protein
MLASSGFSNVYLYSLIQNIPYCPTNLSFLNFGQNEKKLTNYFSEIKVKYLKKNPLEVI